MMPRPDIAALGIKYRRIPILSIGRDVYLDTRLILQKLETIPPSATTGPRLGAPAGEHRALERLLEALVIDAGPFVWAVALIPPDHHLFQDPVFLRDRAGFFPGARFEPPGPAARAEATADMRRVLELLEAGLLADGRDWLLGTAGPGLADVEAVWPLHWLRGIPGAVPQDQLGPKRFPRVWDWVERFDRAVRDAAAKLGEVPTVGGAEAAGTILGSPYFERDGGVRQDEGIVQALRLKKEDGVIVFPTDSGMTHKDSGSLVGLDENEVVFETKAEAEGSPAVRVHAPRHGFRITREDQASHL